MINKVSLPNVYVSLVELHAELGRPVTIRELADHMGRSQTVVRSKLRALGSVGAAHAAQMGHQGVKATWEPLELTEDRLREAEDDQDNKWDNLYSAEGRKLLGSCSECEATDVEVSKHKGQRICRDCLCGGYGPSPVPSWTHSHIAEF